MSSKKQVKKVGKKEVVGYLGFVYGGLFKQGYTHVFTIDKADEDKLKEKFESFKDFYGDNVRCRYVELTDITPEKALETMFDQQKKFRVKEYNIMEHSMSILIKVIKEIAKVDKARKLGFTDDEEEEEEPKKKVDSKKKKVEVEEENDDENEKEENDEDKEEDDEDKEEDDEEETSKKSSKKPSKKKPSVKKTEVKKTEVKKKEVKKKTEVKKKGN
jgi:Mg-chelatase subunit ChlI